MIGLLYQFKILLKDKMIIISFLLPIISAILIANIDEASFTRLTQPEFVYINDSLETSYIEQLEQYGATFSVASITELERYVKDPSTEIIGIVKSNKNYKAMLSGDETDYILSIAKMIPHISVVNTNLKYSVMATSKNDALMDSKQLIISLIIVTSLFIGCSFNAISIVAEKENGINHVYQILPISSFEIILQKISVGFAISAVMSFITWLIIYGVDSLSYRIILLIVATSYFSALLGFVLSKFADDFIGVIINLKFTLIVFIALPVVGLLLDRDELIYKILYFLLPSVPAFNIVSKFSILESSEYIIGLFIIITHCIIWSGLLVFFSKNVARH